MEEWRVLTPAFRQDINKGFDETIAELQTCEQNGLVNAQIEGLYKIRNEVLYANGCYEPDDALDIIDQITNLFEEI